MHTHTDTHTHRPIKHTHIQNGILFTKKEKQVMVFARKQTQPESTRLSEHKMNSERQILNVFLHLWTLDFYTAP